MTPAGTGDLPVLWQGRPWVGAKASILMPCIQMTAVGSWLSLLACLSQGGERFKPQRRMHVAPSQNVPAARGREERGRKSCCSTFPGTLRLHGERQTLKHLGTHPAVNSRGPTHFQGRCGARACALGVWTQCKHLLSSREPQRELRR